MRLHAANSGYQVHGGEGCSITLNQWNHSHRNYDCSLSFLFWITLITNEFFFSKLGEPGYYWYI